MTTTLAEEFRNAMCQAGLDYDGEIVPDGKLHRFKAEGDHAANSWRVLHAGPPVAGAFGCWKLGIRGSHTSTGGTSDERF